MKEQIAYALMDLLEHYSYRDVSVSVICEVAGVSRPTFYNHFKGKDDLARWIVREDFARNGLPLLLSRRQEISTFGFFHYFENHRSFYLRLCQYDDGALLRRALEEAYAVPAEQVDRFTDAMGADNRAVTPEMYRRYVVPAISAAVVNWIGEGMNVPVETLAEDYRTLLGHLARNASGYQL